MGKSKKLTAEQIEDAERLKTLWKEHHTMSQDAFGDKYGLGTQGNVTQYLNAHMPLNLEAGIRFAYGLKIPLDQISPRLAKITALIAPVRQANPLPPRVEILIERIMAITPEQREEALDAILPELGATMDANLVSQRKLKTKLSTIGNRRMEKEFGAPIKMRKPTKKTQTPGRLPDAQMDDIPED